MIYIFDIDGTLCTNENDDYSFATPLNKRIDIVNKLYDDGHTIKIFTARGSATGIDWKELTKKQLVEWKVKHHELIFGKPHADVFIDDKAKDLFSWFKEN